MKNSDAILAVLSNVAEIATRLPVLLAIFRKAHPGTGQVRMADVLDWLIQVGSEAAAKTPKPTVIVDAEFEEVKR